MKIDVILTPRLLPPRFEDAICVVIDVLRATTTIVTALAHGASEVRPCLTAAEAKRYAASAGNTPFLLGGERRGRRIPGFHLGNSPIEYLDSGKISGRVIYFSTTNGTPALRRAYRGSARPVYLGALVNLSAVSTAMVRTAVSDAIKRIFLICAGRHGEPSLEDWYCAGLLVPRLRSELAKCGISPELGDATISAAEYASMNRGKPLAVLAASEHGRYLKSIGFAADLEYASQIDKYHLVPLFDGNRITSAEIAAIPRVNR
jgi:2-phosphosulfolactate phosphatase